MKKSKLLKKLCDINKGKKPIEKSLPKSAGFLLNSFEKNMFPTKNLDKIPILESTLKPTPESTPESTPIQQYLIYLKKSRK